MKLKLGKMTGREVAEWMGISYDGTYRKNPTKYVQRLEDYCEYEQVRGGVVIKEIYLYEYNKDLKAKLTETYLRALQENNNIISLTGLESTEQVSTYNGRKIRNKLFGDKPTNIDPNAHGLIGSRERIWAIKLGENRYRDFTEEEEELFDILIGQDYIDKLTPAAVKAQQLILQCCIKEGYTAAEYQEQLTKTKYNFFNDVIVKFRELTGYQISSPTRHEIVSDWTWECPEEEEEYKKFLYNLVTELQNHEGA